MNTKKIAIIVGVVIALLLAGYVVYSAVTKQPGSENQGEQNAEIDTQIDLESVDLTAVNIPVQPDADVRIFIHGDFGPMLVNKSGMTLYFNSEDGNMESNCSGECAAEYIPFSSESLTIGSYISKTALAVFTRSDGSSQVSFNGKPLYTFSGDISAGDVNGVTEDGVWFIARPQQQ